MVRFLGISQSQMGRAGTLGRVWVTLAVVGVQGKVILMFPGGLSGCCGAGAGREEGQGSRQGGGGLGQDGAAGREERVVREGYRRQDGKALGS